MFSKTNDNQSERVPCKRTSDINYDDFKDFENPEEDCQFYRMLREKKEKELKEKNSPLKLFNYYTRNIVRDEYQMAFQIVCDVVFKADETLALEKREVSYNPHNIAFNTGARISYEDISYTELPSIVKKSADANAVFCWHEC